ELRRIEFCQGFYAQELVVSFVADGFLKQMARNLASCLVAAGQGKLDIKGLRSILESGQRELAPATAPAQGLCLRRIWYPE
ncbi:MAG: tRNA pseudouridine(38-40) synthase TruA, partial [Desulfohalobiaceae bacterium]